MTRLIRAAGGVVFRRTQKGKIRILLVHRPRYDDWTPPKGKAEGDESPEETAIREVFEETGNLCRIVAPLGATRYQVQSGTKEVHWFAMRPLPASQEFSKNSEVDEIQWLSPSKAMRLLSYEKDRDLIAGTDIKRLARTGTIYLVRHATAGDRSKWKGSDELRPLTKKGRRQSEAIAECLADAGIERILSSPYTRCVQSVEPLSKLVKAPVETTPLLAEGPNIDSVYELVSGLIGANTVLCSHGDVIPGLIRRMQKSGLSLGSRAYCSKGSIWAIEVDGGKFTTADYLPPPLV